MRLRKKLVIAAETLVREEKLSRELMPLLSKDLWGKLQLAQSGRDTGLFKLIDLRDSATIQSGRTREFTCSSTIICNKQEGS